MTADHGYIRCRFDGSPEVMADFRATADAADRQNQFSHGLSWLDELDCDGEAESEAVSFDTIDCTREFLTRLLADLPQLWFEGILEHSWPVLPSRRTVVEFSARDGALQWDERQEEETFDSLFPDLEFDDDEDPDDIEIPLTPY